MMCTCVLRLWFLRVIAQFYHQVFNPMSWLDLFDELADCQDESISQQTSFDMSCRAYVDQSNSSCEAAVLINSKRSTFAIWAREITSRFAIWAREITIDYRCADVKILVNISEVSFVPLDRSWLPLYRISQSSPLKDKPLSQKNALKDILRLRCRLKLSNSKSGCRFEVLHLLLNSRPPINLAVDLKSFTYCWIQDHQWLPAVQLTKIGVFSSFSIRF